VFHLVKIYKVRNGVKLIEDKKNEITAGASVITITNRPNYIDEVLNNFLRQNYKKKELIIVLHGNHMNLKEYQIRTSQYKDVKLFQLNNTVHYGICCNFAFEQTNYGYIAIFDDDDYYAPNYLMQALNTFNNVDCDIVGKKSFYIYFEKNKTLALCFPSLENRYVSHVADSSMVIKRKLLEKSKFPCPSDDGVLTVFQQNCFKKGVKIYSTHRFNYVVHRHPHPNKEHSWKISEKELLKNCRIINRNITDYSKHIIF